MSETSRRMAMRQRGYEDGLQGRPPRFDDPEYRRSHRRGRERAALIRGKEKR